MKPTPYPPRLAVTLYLYGESTPTVHDSGEHVRVEVDRNRFDFGIAAWDPDALRRLAAACEEAAQMLERQAAKKGAAA